MRDSDRPGTEGSTLVEYILILLLVVLVIVLYFTVIGTETAEPIGNFANQMHR